jgi:hypothetical protein
MKCSITEQGLGHVVWWNGATLVEEEDQMDQSWTWVAKKVKSMYFIRQLISFRSFFSYCLEFWFRFDPRLNWHRGLGSCWKPDDRLSWSWAFLVQVYSFRRLAGLFSVDCDTGLNYWETLRNDIDPNHLYPPFSIALNYCYMGEQFLPDMRCQYLVVTTAVFWPSTVIKFVPSTTINIQLLMLMKS